MGTTTVSQATSQTWIIRPSQEKETCEFFGSGKNVCGYRRQSGAVCWSWPPIIMRIKLSRIIHILCFKKYNCFVVLLLLNCFPPHSILLIIQYDGKHSNHLLNHYLNDNYYQHTLYQTNQHQQVECRMFYQIL